MSCKAPPVSYAQRFQADGSPASYDNTEYAANGYANVVWQEQKKFLAVCLQQIADRHREGRYLDFACGTGRITSVIENYTGNIDSIDISAPMVEAARRKHHKARFFVGDILAESGLCPGPYIGITAFRLILNLDVALRVPVLRGLRQRLAPDGTLLVNVHGNRNSLRQPAVLWKRWRKSGDPSMLNAMTMSEIARCLAEAGFRIEEKFGFGILPPTLYRLPLRSFWIAADRVLSRLPFLQPFCIDLMFRCSPRQTFS